MNNVIHQMLILLITMAIGFLLGKTGVMTETYNRGLSKLVLHLTLPAMVISAVINGEHTLSPSQIGLLLLLSVVMYVFLIPLAYLSTRILHVPREQTGLYRYLLIFSNVGFLGFPVVSATFGPEAVFYASIFQIPFCFLSYTLGIALISDKEKMPSLWQTALRPGVIAPILGLILYLCNFPVPSLICDIAKSLGGVTTPVATLIIGATVALLPFRKLITNGRLYVVSALKLVVFPLLLWAILQFFVKDSVILGVTVILCAMPVATNVTMICHEYGGDSQLSAAGILISTLLSLVTIPLLAYFLVGGVAA